MAFLSLALLPDCLDLFQYDNVRLGGEVNKSQAITLKKSQEMERLGVEQDWNLLARNRDSD